MRRWRVARAVYRDGPLARRGVHRRGRMCAHAGRGWALAWGGACLRRRTRRYTLCVCCLTWVSSASGGTALWRGGRGAHPRRAAGRPGGTTGCSAWVPSWSSSVSGGVLGGSGKMRNVKSESLPRLATCRASPPRLSGTPHPSIDTCSVHDWIHPPDTIVTKVQSLPMDARVSIRLYILTLKHCPPLSPTHLFPVAPSPVSSSSLVSIRPVQSPLSPSCPVTGFPSASLFLSCCTSPQGRLLHEGVTVHSRVYSVLSSCSLVYAHANASPVWDKETNASGVSVKTRTGRGRGTNRRGATTTLVWIHPTAVVVSVVYEV